MTRKNQKTRLEKLKEHESMLLEMMGKANSRSIAALSKAYRETLRDIEELEGDDGNGDVIAQIIARRG